jgi:protein gp37
MADNTKIEWADATVNAVNGCSVVSPGCTNCYAMRLAGTRMKHHPSRAGLTQDSKAGPVWTGEVRLNETALLDPLKWKRPRRIFWNAHGDLFHDAVPDEWIDRVFAVCALTPQHTHMILTKRSARMREYLANRFWPSDFSLYALLYGPMMAQVEKTMQHAVDAVFPLPNVWLGVSVEDQTRADERIPDLLATPAAVRFISAEPLLGPVDLQYCDSPFDRHDGWPGTYSPLHGSWWPAVGDYEEEYRNREEGLPKLDWVIVGGESGPGARPMHPDWARSLRDQCAAVGVAFHFKQWGEFIPCISDDEGHGLRCYPDGADCDAFFRETKAPIVTAHSREFWRVGKKAAGRLLDGIEHNGFPEAPHG